MFETEDSPDNESETFFTIGHQTSLVRHGTLLSADATPGRNAAELKSILGGSNARLKPGASLPPDIGRQADTAGTPLEQARSRARVELDLLLDSKTCTQGGYLEGHVKVVVPRCIRNELPVMISGAKIRVVGFETISNHRDRYPFYQCSAPLSTATIVSGGLNGLHADVEGFAWAIEGEHKLPFSIHLPVSVDYGIPKGAIQVHSGVAVRYIAMISIKIKDSVSNSRSIAHFYRDCEIWPRLDPSIIFAPAEGPSEASALKGFFLGGPGKVDLTASVHRLHWIAGQQCFVTIHVVNSSKKAITSLSLSLIRTTVVFKPNYPLDTLQDCDMDPDACQTSTSHKEVAESVLEMRQRGTRGHASAKGWWAGVSPGEDLEFSHSILIPPDALTVPRGRLLEVEYSIRVTLSAGLLRTADVQTSIPIQIVNFLSLDPPPHFFSQKMTPKQHADHKKLAIGAPLFRPYGKRPMHTDVVTLESYKSISRRGSLSSETSDVTSSSTDRGSLGSTSQMDSLPQEHNYDSSTVHGDDILRFYTWQEESYRKSHGGLKGLAMYEDDTDANASYLLHVDPDFEDAPRFAELYHMSTREDVRHTREMVNSSFQRSKAYTDMQDTQDSMHTHSLGRSSFAQRVQAKIEAAASASHSKISTDMPGSANPEADISTPMPVVENQEPPSLNLYNGTDCKAENQALNNQIPTFQIGQRRDDELGDRADISDCNKVTFSHIGAAQPLVSDPAPMALRRDIEPSYPDWTAAGSRQLPKPPPITAIHLNNVLSAPIRKPTTSFNFKTQPEEPQYENDGKFNSDGLVHQDFGDDSRHLCQSGRNQVLGVDGRNGDLVGATPTSDPHPIVSIRPSISALRDHANGGMGGGSSTSVKERIKELEERQRLLELNGA